MTNELFTRWETYIPYVTENNNKKKEQQHYIPFICLSSLYSHPNLKERCYLGGGLFTHLGQKGYVMKCKLTWSKRQHTNSSFLEDFFKDKIKTAWCFPSFEFKRPSRLFRSIFIHVLCSIQNIWLSYETSMGEIAWALFYFSLLKATNWKH